MDENERTESIRQLQRALRTLHKNGSDIPEVKDDGIFGAETTAAVKAFQKSVGMEQTGEVDFQTWKNIMNETRACIDRITPPQSHRGAGACGAWRTDSQAPEPDVRRTDAARGNSPRTRQRPGYSACG